MDLDVDSVLAAELRDWVLVLWAARAVASHHECEVSSAKVENDYHGAYCPVVPRD
jgi:hypothetical protein